MAATKKEAARYAFTAGLEMDMMSHAYDRHLQELVEEGKVSMAQVDEVSVRRVPTFEIPSRLCSNVLILPQQEKERFFRPKNMDIAARLAAESMVLLKNENKRLPLTEKEDCRDRSYGKKWLGLVRVPGVVTERIPMLVMLYDGLAAEFAGKAELRYAQGCNTKGDNREGFAEALEAARWSDVVVLCLGEMMTWSGENASRSSIALPQMQEELAKELKKVGKPVVLVLVNGRPLELNVWNRFLMLYWKSGSRV